MCKGFTPAYHSVKLIKVKNTTLAAIYYTTVVALLTYVIGYAIIAKKGYQEYEELVGTSRVKVKGVADLNGTVYDATDLTFPDMASTHMFITTNMVHTRGQQRGTCEGRKHEGKCACAKGKGLSAEKALGACCPKGKKTWNGVLTGRCGGRENGYCEVRAWCPIEVHPDKKELEATALTGVEHWTVLVATRIKFPKFNVTRLNTRKIKMGVNLFKVKDLFGHTGFSKHSLSTGASVVLQMMYDCDLNLDESKCKPTVQILPLLKEHHDKSHGVNFRSVREYTTANGTLMRDVTKRFGLLLDVQLYGRAGKFSLVPLLLTFGAGMALLGFATLACDFIMQWVLPQKQQYKGRKYEVVDGGHADLSEGRGEGSKGDDTVVTPLLAEGRGSLP